MSPHPSVRPSLPRRTAFAAHLLCVSLAACAATALPHAALAQPASAAASGAAARNYSIPAGPLGQALNWLGRESGTLITFAPELVAGVQSPGARGSLTLEQALNALLAGTGLAPVSSVAGEYTLQRTPAASSRPASKDAIALGEVQVVASAERDATTEGTGAYASKAPSATSTRLPLEWQETPQSLTILTRQRLDDQRLDRVDSAVESAIGVIAFRQSMGSDLTSGLMSRGFAVGNYEVDGIPSSSSLNTGNSTVLYDRVEIVRGATGLMSGLGTPGATINLMRKRPTITPQRSVSVDAGSWSRHGGTADFSGPLNASASVRGRLIVDAREADSFVDRYRNKNSTVYGIVEADLSNATLLTAGLSQQRDDNSAPLRTGFPLYYSDGSRLVLPRSYNSSPNWSYYDSTVKNAFVSLEHRLDNGWRGKLEYNHRQFSYDGIVSYLSGDIDRSTGLGGEVQAAHWNGAPEENNLDGYVTGHFPLFGRQHELVAGFTLSRMQARNAPSYGWFVSRWTGYDGAIGDIHTWDGSVTPPVFTLASHGDTQVRQHAAYATSRFNLTDDAKLIVGARVTDWEQTTATRPVSGAASSTLQRETGVVTPYAGLVYRLSDSLSAYGSYTKIFKPQGYGVFDINGRGLDPEAGTSVETGLKADLLGGRLQASAAVFQTRLDNSAIRDESIQDTRIFIAQKGLKSRGLELELAGELARGWNLSAGYAFTSTKDAQGADTMTQIPRNSVKLFTTYRVPALQALTLGGGFTWQSASGYSGYYMEGSHAVASLLARYEINRNLTLALNVNNLFDKNYYTGTATHALYGAPRNAVATLTYKY
ncbi:TonB-dependent siderophore receptor [Acidovorax sp. CCYZU-2555]|uniref:TonB-dependent siderophore receptor n=1 Tax=Acidovorax sp. CCYZU-2555 TaxID=2835042 RepID=UPI001BD136E4|nr:TonB-dependent siderophore receptor [Acidovorax sp. CCYZU-2555]MBS7779260.1 TonB-dependent siderophore receptor [Acidovorax sp. CCYZU-2555]